MTPQDPTEPARLQAALDDAEEVLADNVDPLRSFVEFDEQSICNALTRAVSP